MPSCNNCDRHVSERYVAVFSPDGETVRCCYRNDCDLQRDGRDVRDRRAHSGGTTEPTTYEPEKAGGNA
ncbi:DUF7563 family protein [Haloarcula amylovorans]|uniref:DUF7563 family protein n=1 Tax=Haloarcula amylovorans TaxID=2562280 RepID=UPI0010765F9A|nr:hypothetical protein [Halomicroarcula amylolytica]